MSDLSLRPDYLIQRGLSFNRMAVKQKWSLNEFRFLDAYMAKIDARHKNTRRVTFGLDEFREVFGLKDDSDVAKPGRLRPIAESIVGRVMIEDYSEGDGLDLRSFLLFKSCKIERNGDGKWYVEIEAHEDAVPFLFDLKEAFFGCRLGVVARLDSGVKRNLYFIIRQGEYRGEITMPLPELIERVCGKGSGYDFRNFKRFVLEKCKALFREVAGLSFEYERIRGAHNKTTGIRFFGISSEDPYRRIDLDAPIRIVDDLG